ncbi:hypothetical protein KCU91_g71, partial [Aureobasidium melanogenum]
MSERNGNLSPSGCISAEIQRVIIVDSSVAIPEANVATSTVIAREFEIDSPDFATRPDKELQRLKAYMSMLVRINNSTWRAEGESDYTQVQRGKNVALAGNHAGMYKYSASPHLGLCHSDFRTC